MTGNNLVDKLGGFGLTENDSKVFLFLLEKGVHFGASKISTALKLHRQYVHNSLEKLAKLNLIEVIGEDRRKKYQAMPPSSFTKFARAKYEQAQIIEKDLLEISGVDTNQTFEVYRGKYQVTLFEERLIAEMSDNESQYIIGGCSDLFIKFFGDSYDFLAADSENKKLTSFYIGSRAELPWLERAKSLNSSFNYRILDNFPSGIINISIRFGGITMYSFGNPPIVYVLKGQEVFTQFKKFFDMLWEMAEEKK